LPRDQGGRVIALSLGVKRGRKIKIGSSILTVTKVASLNQVEIDVDGKPYTITDLEATQIMPNVRVFCGKVPGHLKGMVASVEARLAFEAPIEIKITRVRR
jgi:sRNA-binding carbon storage regulator CsrA